jgi:hypothetical protein
VSHTAWIMEAWTDPIRLVGHVGRAALAAGDGDVAAREALETFVDLSAGYREVDGHEEEQSS